MIQVIDYKAGNLTSVVMALNYLGAQTHVTQSPADILNAEKIVLPSIRCYRATRWLLVEKFGTERWRYIL